MQTYSMFGLPATGGQGDPGVWIRRKRRHDGQCFTDVQHRERRSYHVSFQYVIQQGGGFEDLVGEALDGAVFSLILNTACGSVLNVGPYSLVLRNRVNGGASASIRLSVGDCGERFHVTRRGCQLRERE
jgi:hypothetical protein